MIKTKKHIDLFNWIMSKTSHITESEINLTTRIYMLLNDIYYLPHCKTCGKRLVRNVTSINDGFGFYCNTKCSMNDKDIQKKLEDQCLKKYGKKHVSQVKEIRDKVKNTLKKNFGVENPMDIPGSVEKIKQTKKEKYGDENYNNPEKNKKTCLERYGVEYSSQSEIMKEHSRETCMDKYGVPNAGWIEESQKKIKETNLKKYGVEYSMQNKEIQKKSENTFIKKYGVKTPFLLDRVRDISTKTMGIYSYDNILMKNEYDIPCFTKDEYLNRENDNIELKFKCKKCGSEFYAKHQDGTHHRCPNCYPSCGGTSNDEKEIFEYITSLVDCEVKSNDRSIITPLELDIYIPDKKIAFEYDGLYWHSIACKEKNYHINKTKLCEEQGIQLIHIFENEWITKKNIVKSRIKNLISSNTSKIFARKCTIKEVDGMTSFDFLDNNHIQGGIRSSINIGLYNKDDLVALMCFSKERFSKKYEYELTRFCTKLDTSVIGGASRLMKYFERTYHPKSIVSYADRRWSMGKMYENLGFTLDHVSPPCYWYFKSNDEYKLHSRIKFQKHKLSKLLENYDESKSEMKNMIDNGWNAIYDCGNYVFKKEYK